MNNKRPQKNRGSAAFVTLFVFLGISLAIIFAFSAPVIQSSRIVASAYDSKEGYFTAEALTEDVIYKLNNSMSVDASESLSVGDYSATAVVTDVGGNKQIVVTGESGSVERSISASVSTDVGVSFSYGVQTGNGGFTLSNNATVIGNVYANGSITGSNGARITGSAIAADSSPLTSDQSNTLPAVPTQSINFRNVSASQDFAQSFVTSTTSNINKIQLYIRKTGTPANATVRIVTNNGTSPGTTNIVTGTLNASLVTNTYGWIDVVFSSNPVLTAGTTYWVVVDNGTQSASHFYTIGANTAYGSGQARVGSYGGSWNNTSPVGLDGYFNVFLGGISSVISGVVVGTTGSDLAWANVVNNTTITGPLFCQQGSGNNKTCDTTRPNPSTQPFPISDSNISAWKADAEDGTVFNGNYNATTSRSIGPMKIIGNLVVDNNVIVTLNGTLYVTGNVSITNNSGIRLSSSYGTNSGILVSDGRILLNNNGTFSGSGQSGSYLLVVTTSDCPTSSSCAGQNAIHVGNNAGSVILNAQNGTLFVSNNAGLKAGVAKTISIENNATITYESGLQNPNFSSGPSGSWTLNSWQEVE